MAEQKISWYKVMIFSGAIVAYLIGSGFATGQEVMQFFSNYGLWGCIGSLLVAFITLTFTYCMLLKEGNRLRLKNPSDLYDVYTGKTIGMVYKVFCVGYTYSLFVLMLAGAGTVMHEYYGLNRWVGSTATMIISVVIVLFGLDGIVKIIGKLGPLLIVAAVAIGTYTMIIGWPHLGEADTFLANLEEPPLLAAKYWFIAGLLNATAPIVQLVPFLSGMGTEASNEKEAVWGGGLGGFLYIFGCTAMGFGLLAFMSQIYHLQAPALGLADIMIPGLGNFYTVIVVLGILTSAVPNLWSPCITIAPNEKSTKFRVLVVVAGVLGLFGGQLKFSLLINILIPLAGYVGLLLTVCIVLRHVFGVKFYDESKLVRLPDGVKSAKELGES